MSHGPDRPETPDPSQTPVVAFPPGSTPDDSSSCGPRCAPGRVAPDPQRIPAPGNGFRSLPPLGRRPDMTDGARSALILVPKPRWSQRTAERGDCRPSNGQSDRGRRGRRPRRRRKHLRMQPYHCRGGPGTRVGCRRTSGGYSGLGRGAARLGGRGKSKIAFPPTAGLCRQRIPSEQSGLCEMGLDGCRVSRWDKHKCGGMRCDRNAGLRDGPSRGCGDITTAWRGPRAGHRPERLDDLHCRWSYGGPAAGERKNPDKKTRLDPSGSIQEQRANPFHRAHPFSHVSSSICPKRSDSRGKRLDCALDPEKRTGQYNGELL